MNVKFKGEIVELEKLVQEFKFNDIPEELKKNWKAAMQAYPDNTPFFLEDSFIDEMLERFCFLSEFKNMFKKAAKIAKHDENISAIAWLWYYTAYISKEWSTIYSWPGLSNALGELEGMIPILVLFAGYDKMIDFYNRRRIPEEVRDSNDYGIEISFDWFKKMYKTPGVGNNVLAWAVRYFGGTLFYLGRLQYEIINCHNNILVYRNRRTNEVVCLAEDGQEFRSDGQYNGTNNIIDEKSAWVSEYKEFDRVVQGYPISPESYAIKKMINLDKEEWELKLKKGDPVLSIHIPGVGKLDYNLVKESFLETVPFFDTYFPELHWRGVICNSWLLDTQLRDFLNENANIVKFQDCFYLFPIYSPNSTGVYRFLFNVNVCDPQELPVNSSLQARVRDYMINGGKIKSGGGFVLKEDLEVPRGHYQQMFKNIVEKLL